LEKKVEMEKRCTAGIVRVYCPGGHLKDDAGESSAVLEKKAEDIALYFTVGDRLIPVDEESATLQQV